MIHRMAALGPWVLVASPGQSAAGIQIRSGATGSTSSAKAVRRLHPRVRHGALRRRRCEGEQPHTISWRAAEATDAEEMSRKSRARRAPDLTEASSWMADRRALQTSAYARMS